MVLVWVGVAVRVLVAVGLWVLLRVFEADRVPVPESEGVLEDDRVGELVLVLLGVAKEVPVSVSVAVGVLVWA